MQLPATTSDSLLTVFDFVGGESLAPSQGGERARVSNESFDALLASLDLGQGVEVAGPGRAERAAVSTVAPMEVSDDARRRAADGTTVVILPMPGVFPKSPAVPTPPTPEFDVRRPATGEPTASNGEPTWKTADDVIVRDATGAARAAVVRIDAGSPAPAAQVAESEGSAIAPYRGNSTPTPIGAAPATELPAAESNPASSTREGRTIAPARDGGTAIPDGPHDASASRVWTFVPKSAHFRRPVADRAGLEVPEASEALPVRDLAAATWRQDVGPAPALPQVAATDARRSSAVDVVSRTSPVNGIAREETRLTATTPLTMGTAVPSAPPQTSPVTSPPISASHSRSSESRAAPPVHSDVAAETPGDHASTLTASSFAEPTMDELPTEPMTVPQRATVQSVSSDVRAAVQVSATDARAVQARGTVLPEPRSTTVRPGSGISDENVFVEDADPQERVEAGSTRPATVGAAAAELPGIELQVQHSHSPAAPAIDADITVDADQALAADNSSGASGEGEAGATRSITSTSGTESLISAPATMEANVVQQIGEAVEAWRDALQDQGTARISAWLTPPDLGHVWIELTRSADGLTARLVASDDSVQSLLETQAPELKAALSDSGITVTELDLSGRPAGDFSSSRQHQSPERDQEQELAPDHQQAPVPRGRTPRRAAAVDVRA